MLAGEQREREGHDSGRGEGGEAGGASPIRRAGDRGRGSWTMLTTHAGTSRRREGTNSMRRFRVANGTTRGPLRGTNVAAFPPRSEDSHDEVPCTPAFCSRCSAHCCVPFRQGRSRLPDEWQAVITGQVEAFRATTARQRSALPAAVVQGERSPTPRCSCRRSANGAIRPSSTRGRTALVPTSWSIPIWPCRR